MAATNGAATFGWVTRALHWLTALIVLSALPLGLWIARMEPSLAAIRYFGLHKTLGVTALALVLFRILWHRMTPVPAPLPGRAIWQDRAARMTHSAFYVLLIAMPLSGWIASSATGIDTVVFRYLTLPRIAPVSEAWETVGFAIHGFIGWCLIVLVVLHVAGALHRAFVLRDGTLMRMLTGHAATSRDQR